MSIVSSSRTTAKGVRPKPHQWDVHDSHRTGRRPDPDTAGTVTQPLLSAHRGGLMSRNWLVAGSITGFLTVAGGAFGAHALKATLTAASMAVFETGVRYAMLHTAALLVTGLL